MRPSRWAALFVLTTGALVLSLIASGVAVASAPRNDRFEASLAAPDAPAAVQVSLTPSFDTYANEDFPTTNYGSSADLVVARTTEFLTLRRSYLKFNLSSIPGNAVVSSAVLSIYLKSGSGPIVTLTVYQVNSDWTTGGATPLTWNNQPAIGQSRANNAVSTTAGRKTWTLTSLVQEWINGTTANYGVVVRGPETSSVEWVRTFDSLQGSNDPVLVVNYSVPTATPTRTPTHTSTRTPTPIPPCADAQEPNNTFGQAFLIVPAVEYLGCIPTPSDLDYFRFNVNPNTAIKVELFGLPANYDLYLYAPNQTLLDSSVNGGVVPETVEYTTGATGGQFYAKVQSSSGAADFYNPYHLKLTLTSLTPTPTATPSRTPTATRTATPSRTRTTTVTRTATSTRTPGGPTSTPTATVTPPPARYCRMPALCSNWPRRAARRCLIASVMPSATGQG